ncbi:transmembrane protein, putative (macronuclear) [Tetrahymena thermophila SB210]|uniref:Transmembrane protein, putative n=1 Tax=Tetrahymena thermophila (strain SB210) TaxID=312017 RepID=W7XLE0_TETTS|nr:transmembrane protein, putative [Tetrahymena thermophila SB210]EWS76124.1 transmembrane protein, putative [Tetrahymena thermophila SB210]|eukprot:XP_012651364.1 transmembrane protein, putative [Tetrahymena thermophila SB210]
MNKTNITKSLSIPKTVKNVIKQAMFISPPYRYRQIAITILQMFTRQQKTEHQKSSFCQYIILVYIWLQIIRLNILINFAFFQFFSIVFRYIFLTFLIKIIENKTSDKLKIEQDQHYFVLIFNKQYKQISRQIKQPRILISIQNIQFFMYVQGGVGFLHFVFYQIINQKFVYQDFRSSSFSYQSQLLRYLVLTRQIDSKIINNKKSST